MKTYLLLLTSVLLTSPALAAGNYATPGQCGAGFDLWDLNCDGKIDGDEAEESQREYHEYNNVRHIPAAREGISDAEVAAWNKWAEENKNPNLQSGIWVKISRQPLDIKSYVVLSGDSSGYACAPSGVYGKQPYEECVHVGNGDYRCKTYNNYYQCQ